MISGIRLLVRPMRRNIRKVGMMVTATGSIILPMIQVKTIFFPIQFTLDRP